MTRFLAVLGAILASITFGWTLYRDLRDRAKIRISARLRLIGRREGDGAFFCCGANLNIEQAGGVLVSLAGGL